MDKLYNYTGQELDISNDASSIMPTALFRGGIDMIAHRGSFFLGMPENSVPAFLTAKYLGYKYIECDVRATYDSKYVIMHDTSINRTCKTSSYNNISGTVNVASTTLSALRNNYVLISDNPKYRTKIPTLEEYLIACRGGDTIAMVELEELTNAQIQEIYDICVRYLGRGKFVFNSNFYEELDFVRSIDSDIDLFYENHSILNTSSTVDSSSRNNIHNIWYAEYSGSMYGNVTEQLIKQYHDLGMRVFLWTVPSGSIESSISLGVDGIATNDVPSQMIGAASTVIEFNGQDNDDIQTNGTIQNNTIVLSSGQYVMPTNINSTTGMKCIRICASGQYTVTTGTTTFSSSAINSTTQFSKQYTDADIVTHELLMFYSENDNPLLTITANANTTIYSIYYYDVAIQI